MAIYPDKKDGKLTGRFRVELQKGKTRYRKRWDSLKDAQADEKAVLAAWERGEELDGTKRAIGSPEVHTLSSVIPLADGSLWAGRATEAVNFSHLYTIAGILGPSTRLDAIDTLMVDRLISALGKKGKADGTINRYLSKLRTFLTWAKGRKYRTASIEDIEFAWRKESVGRIRWITADEEATIKDFCLSKGWSDIWDLVVVGIETGCRLAEITSAELDQVRDNRLHLWKTKTDRPRTVPMSDDTTARLVGLIERKAFPSKQVLRNRWVKIKAHMGLQDDAEFVFHTCRHTCATRMVDAGVNVFVIKEWMGHSNIETTLRYAHVKPQNLEEALAKVGDHRLTVGQKPSISAARSLPHAYPTGGENTPNRLAA